MFEADSLMNVKIIRPGLCLFLIAAFRAPCLILRDLLSQRIIEFDNESPVAEALEAPEINPIITLPN
jgi:hypothetical protein